jgi:peptide-methionine (S)-S-oxide reductase
VTPPRRALASRILATLIAGAVVAQCAPAQAENVVKLPAAAVDPAVQTKRATAVLAGGCFWGVEGVFSNVKGVVSVESGYHGGNAATARYEQTHDGKSGHAEAVRIVYDPSQVSYGTLLRILFSVVADPTLKNRQGPDSGTQYRAAIVPMDAGQRQVATAYLTQIGKGNYFAKPVVVPVESYKRFYPAEANHQDFMRRNPSNGYILRWDAPKLAALKRLFPTMVRATPAP